MARKHGRGGRMYVALTSGGSAELVAYIKSWSIDFKTNRVEVTAQGDDNKVYLQDLPDAQGAFDGYYDDSTAQLYTAASDGAARKMYLYPSKDTVGQYFFGTAFCDFSISDPVDGATAISGSWAAASNFAKVG